MISYIVLAPSWLVGGIMGAAVAALAGLILAALSRVGFDQKRYRFIYAIIFGIAGVGGPRIGELVQRQLITPEVTGQLLKSRGPALYGLLETSFPDDYASITAQLTELTKSGATDDEVQQRSASIMAELRRKYAPMLRLASDADQAALLEATIRLYQVIYDVDPLLCSSFAVAGFQEFPANLDEALLLDLMGNQSMALFRAAASGVQSPTHRREATEEDGGQLAMLMLAQGATLPQIEAIGAPQRNSADLCPGLIKLMRVLKETDSEPVKAMRAQFVEGLASN